MDQLQTRLDALEQQMHTVNRRLRWWRGLAGGLLMLAVLTWALPAVIAQEETAQAQGQRGLAQRVAALEKLLKHVSREGHEITITGANLHLINGLGRTGCEDDAGNPIPACPNGLGNLIVGYNEPRSEEPPISGENIRTGSHNVVVGQEHNFSRFGGLVVGNFNTISGDFAAVSGGRINTASGFASSVSGGRNNIASASTAAVSGGDNNTASGDDAAVSGGLVNTASGPFSVVSGGVNNTVTGESAVVSGGASNVASGLEAAVSGGGSNIASGQNAVVSGGQNITQETAFGWSAGSEADEVVVGNFRSP
jgi:hypothetical protein